MAQTILRFDTVTPLLKDTLETLMAEPMFSPFRLVGGTNLSLRYGHRLSVDIDLFSDAEYGSLDFGAFEKFLRSRFPFYQCTDTTSIVSFGRGYLIGNSATDHIKLDLMYADPFISRQEVIDGIRMAGTDDIVAMKMNVISRGGRKKDFWDIHYLLGAYTLPEMFALHARRHEWEHNPAELAEKFVDFSIADEMPDPVCLLGKDWDELKLDLIDMVNAL